MEKAKFEMTDEIVEQSVEFYNALSGFVSKAVAYNLHPLAIAIPLIRSSIQLLGAVAVAAGLDDEKFVELFNESVAEVMKATKDDLALMRGGLEQARAIVAVSEAAPEVATELGVVEASGSQPQ